MRIAAKKFIKSLVCPFLYYARIISLVRLLFPRKGVVILGYHELDQREFEKHIQYLKKFYNILSMDEFVEGVKEKRPVRKNSVVITFDDGYQSVYKQNFPILKAYQIPATVFLAIHFIENGEKFWWDKIKYALQTTQKNSLEIEHRKYGLKSVMARRETVRALARRWRTLSEAKKRRKINEIFQQLEVNSDGFEEVVSALTWREINEMQLAGVTIGAHTLSHPVLSMLPLDEARREIQQSKSILEDRIGRAVRYFSYPFGEASDFNESTKQIVKQSGFAAAICSIQGFNEQDVNLIDIFELRRLVIGRDDTLPVLAAKVSGLWGFLTRWMRFAL